MGSENFDWFVLVTSLLGSGGLVSIMMKWIMGSLTTNIKDMNSSIVKSFQDMNKSVVDSFKQMNSSVSESIKHLTLMQTELYKLFLAHDAQVRGINPSAGGDQNERESMALREYKKLHESLDNIAKSIEKSS